MQLTKAHTPLLNIDTHLIHLLPHFRNDGNGIVNSVIDLACAQARAGYQVTCVAQGTGSFRALLETAGVATVTNPNNDLFAPLSHLFLLYHLLEGVRPKVVHAHTVPTAFLGCMLRSVRNFIFVTTVHNGPHIKSAMLATGQKVICVSGYVSNRMKRFGVSAKKLRIVMNGPLGSLRRGQLLSSPVVLRRRTVITIAGLHPHKGVHELIEAFSIAVKVIPDLILQIVGKGPMEEELKKLARRMDCETSVRFAGFVDDPRSYLNAADVFVLASHRETFGLALAEAREAGCAIVATNVGGAPEVLENGNAGILVPARNPPAIAKVLIELLTDDKMLLKWKRRASSNLQWLHTERVTQETLAVYEEARIGTQIGMRNVA